MICLEGL
jgi:hypothetical protein